MTNSVIVYSTTTGQVLWTLEDADALGITVPVKEGEIILALESCKCEFPYTSPITGNCLFLTSPGECVTTGTELARITP